ncbi:MAG: CidA/LrgA family protein [Propionibacteriaceae bacterium]|jgi:holin-like protein|nr:CidA/LrgA family protein [Propionibacteriaceae bacterium]
MRYLKQFALITAFCLVGEAIEQLTPLPIPGSVYGMVLMFALLCLKVIKVEQVKDVALFLVSVMQVFFIPAGVGIISVWPLEKTLLVASAVAITVFTLLVMGVSGQVTQLVQRLTGTTEASKENAPAPAPATAMEVTNE